MKFGNMLLMLGSLAIATGQAVSNAIVTNLDTANWTHDKGAAAGSEGVLLRTDATNGGMDLLVRYPAGHVIAPHFHESNERIFVVEGQITLKQDTGEKLIKAGGYAYLPAKEVQRLSCTSTTRCTFYLTWDRNPKSH